MTREELINKRKKYASDNNYSGYDTRKYSQNNSVKSMVDNLYVPANTITVENVTNRANQIMTQTENKQKGVLQNLAGDTKNIFSNLFLGAKKSGESALYYIDTISDPTGDRAQIDARVNELNKIKNAKTLQERLNVENNMIAERNSNFSFITKKNLDTESAVQKVTKEKMNEDEQKIAENIENSSNKVSKKIAELTPSIGQSITGMGLSAINPGLSVAYWQTSAGGDYIRQAEEKGLKGTQAQIYGTIMGSMESITESIGAKLTENVGKAFFKEGAKKGLTALGLDIGENFFEEAIMEPIDEVVTQLSGGEADYSNISSRMFESGINGALTSILMGGASAGIGKASNIIFKVQNGQQVTQEEIADALKEINKNEDIDIEKLLTESFKYTAQDLYKNLDVENSVNQKSDNIAIELSQEEARNILPIKNNEVEKEINNSKLSEEDKTSLKEFASQKNLSNDEVKKLIDNRLAENQPTTIENKAVSNQEQQTIPNEPKTTQNVNTSETKASEQNNEKNVQNDYEKVLNDAKFIPESEKEALLKDAEGTSVEEFKEFVNQMNETYKEQDNEILDTNKTYSTGRKETYTKYMGAKNEYDTSALEKAKQTIQGSNRAKGKRSKSQWLQVANMIGTEIANKSNQEIEEIAYRTWQDERPNYKDNLNREGQNYVAFTSDEWINAIYNSVKQARGNYNIDLKEQTEKKTNLLPYQQVTSKDDMTTSAKKYGLKYDNISIQNIQKALEKRGIKARFDESYFSSSRIGALYSTNREIIFNPNANAKTIIQEMAVHELTHDLIASGTKTSKELRDSVLSWVEKDADYKELRKSVEQAYKEAYKDKTPEQFKDLIDEEIVAKTLQKKFGTQEEINRLAKENRNIAQRIYDFIVDKIDSFKNRKDAEYLYWKDIQKKFEKAFNNKEFNSNENNKRLFSINPNFITEYDTWNKIDRNGYFVLGKTSESLKQVGLNDYDIVMDKSKILKILNDHPEMNDNLIKQIPNILENPTLIIKSQSVPGRIVVFSEVIATNNKPVLVAMELNPDENKNNIDKIYKVASAYGRKNVATIQNWLNVSENILYIDKQKNRTINWLNGLGLQLPVPNNTNSSTNSIPSSKKDVNTNNNSMQNNIKYSINTETTDNKGRKLSKEQQEYFKDSKILDRNGLLLTVYHGTNNEFNIFDSKYVGNNTKNAGFYGDGFYFTPNNDSARQYGKNKKEVYLNIKNPFSFSELSKYNGEDYYTDYVQIMNLTNLNDEWNNIPLKFASKQTWGDISNDVKKMIEQGKTEEEIDGAMYEKYGELPDRINDRLYNYSKENGYKTLSTVLKEKGYDGIINSDTPGNSSEIVAFDSNQIKNVDNTNPTSNPDIRYSIDNDYQGSHQIDTENSKTLDSLDITDLENRVKKVNGGLSKQDYSDLNRLRKILNNKNEKVTIYRASPVNELNNGDWVTTDKSYAQSVAKENGGKVYTYQVNANDLLYPNNLKDLPSLHRLSSFQYYLNDTRYSNATNFDEYLENRLGTEGTRTSIEELRQARLPERPRLPEKKIDNARYDLITDNVYREEINGKPRKHLQSIYESDQIGQAGKDIALEEYKNLTYTPVSNLETITKVNDNIARVGLDDTYTAFTTKIKTNETLTLQDIATGERLIQIYSQNGDIEKLREVIQDVAILGTELGQQVQALSLIKKASPEGQLQYLQKIIDRTNQKDNLNLQVTNEMAEQIMQSKNSEELQENVSDIAEAIANEIPPTVSDQLRAWRYLSMLGNPKTHIKNLGGNVFMNLTQQAKNKVAGGIEDVRSIFNPDIERTKTLKLANQDQRDFAKKDAEVMKDLIDGGGKYDIKNIVQQSKKQFNNKVLNAIAEFNSNMLEKEDTLFLKTAYKQAMQMYMSANNLSSTDMTGETLERARQYASFQAQEATFHQFSAVAEGLQKFENTNETTKFIMGSLLPFKKTPINVAKTGFQYSPLELAKSLTYDLGKLNSETNKLNQQFKDGKITAEELKTEKSKLLNKQIDNFAKGFTGTSIALIGFFLAQAGLLKAGNDGKDDEFEEEIGNQEYSIKLGNSTYTLDWMSPTAIPLFTGATIYDLVTGEKDFNKDYIGSTATALSRAFEPMTEMSMLQGLTSAISSYNHDSSMILDLGTSLVTSYAGQYIPTVVGQVAKTVDPYVRTTTSTEKGITKQLDSFKNQTFAKLPGLTTLLPVKKDVWGEDVKKADNIIQRFLEVSALPYNRKQLVEDTTTQELLKIFPETDENVLPQINSVSKEVTIDGEKYRFSSEEYNQAKETYGQTAKTLLDDLVSSEGYNKLDTDGKAEAITQIYDYAKESIKQEYAQENNLAPKTSKNYDTLTNLRDEGGDTSAYLEFQGRLKQIDLENGDESIKSKEKLRYLSELETDNNTKRIIYEDSLGSTDDTYQALKSLTGNKVSINSYLDYKSQEFKATDDPNSNIKGKTISGSKKDKVIDYINKSNLSGVEKLYIYGTQYKMTKAEKQALQNAINSLTITQNQKEEIYLGLSSSNIVQYEDGSLAWK